MSLAKGWSLGFIWNVRPPQDSIVETLRGRILRGLRSGTLESGNKLPSAREVAAEFQVEHRLVLSAYRALAEEGLVQVRERGGVYIAQGHVNERDAAAVPLAWMADILAEGYAREIPGPDLAGHLQRAIETLRLRAVVISSTDDQVSGLARELRDDFGLIADGITAAAITSETTAVSGLLKRADLLVATSAHADVVAELATRMGKTSISIELRPDLAAGEWAMLLRQPVWAVVATQEFAGMLKRFFAHVRGIENLHVLVHGEDDLSVIPEGAPTYVTHRVREALAVTSTKGRLLPPARTISVGSARQIFEFMVRANFRARETVEELNNHPAKRA